MLVAPIYIAEIAPFNLRGALVSFNQFNIVLGIFVAFLSNYFLKDFGDNSWRWMLGIETIPAIVYFALLLSVPRSPRWLILERNNYEQARKILTKFGGEIYADKTILDIKEGLQNEENQQKSTLQDLVKKKYRLIMLIAFGLAFFQQITGINAIFYYAPTIFEQAGGGLEDAFTQALLVIGVFIEICTLFFVDVFKELLRIQSF